MDDVQIPAEETRSSTEHLGTTAIDWLVKNEGGRSSDLQYIALKMDKTLLDDKEQESSTLENWQSVGGNGDNSTLVYIAVEYVKNDIKNQNCDSITHSGTAEAYADFVTPQVSPLDPNMSSAARYSPVSVQYQENCGDELGPIIIQEYVGQDNQEQQTFTRHITADSSLENLSTALCNEEERQYLELVENGNITVNQNNSMQLVSENDQQNVELLITDHAMGVSYSVNAQELLVQPCLNDEQHLLEALTPNPILGSDIFSLSEQSAKPELSNASVVNSVINDEAIINYMNSLTRQNDDSNVKLVRNNSSISCADEEERLLSCVFSIPDKPILSRARASLPEAYLSIIKIDEENAVIAKRLISKRAQFGPLKGILDVCKKEIFSNRDFLMMVDGLFYSVDVSDEENSNWMSFVRRASSYEEQNLIVSQQGNGLYFTAIRNIKPKEELKVGYGHSYAEQFGLVPLRPTGKRTWFCYECSDGFSSSESLQQHYVSHEQESNQNMKPKRKYKRTNASIPGRTQGGIVECNTCHEVFNNTVSSNVLKSHLMEKHKLSGQKTAENFSVHECFQCDICEMPFKLEILLKIHKLEHDADLPLDQPNHVCPQCQRKFPTRKQLVLHVSTHALSKRALKNDNVKCGVCHKNFAHPIRLQKHMLCHGSEENKPLQCKTCKKRFLTKSALTFHGKIHVVGEKQFECSICKERFDHMLKLKLHIPKHAQNNSYSCPICKKVFSKYAFIRKHMRFHKERKHQCPHCPKAFGMHEFLKKHLLRHSEHREFLCADCGKQFKRKDKLADHIKKLHLEGDNKKARKKVKKIAPSSLKEPADFHRFIYKCHTCLVGFKRRGMLVNHLAKRHPDIRPDSVPELNLPILQTIRDYYCQYCDKVYKSSVKRKLHILKNHPGAALPTNNGDKEDSQNISFSTTGSVTTRPKNCQWCHRQYARKCKLLQHIRKAHPTKVVEIECQQKQQVNQTVAVVSVSTSLDDVATPNVSDSDVVSHETSNYPEVLSKNQSGTDGNITEITRTTVIDGLIDEDSKYCRLSIDENGIIESGELENPNTQLYHLLTAANGIIPPR